MPLMTSLQSDPEVLAAAQSWYDTNIAQECVPGNWETWRQAAERSILSPHILGVTPEQTSETTWSVVGQRAVAAQPSSEGYRLSSVQLPLVNALLMARYGVSGTLHDGITRQWLSNSGFVDPSTVADTVKGHFRRTMTSLHRNLGSISSRGSDGTTTYEIAPSVGLVYAPAYNNPRVQIGSLFRQKLESALPALPAPVHVSGISGGSEDEIRIMGCNVVQSAGHETTLSDREHYLLGLMILNGDQPMPLRSIRMFFAADVTEHNEGGLVGAHLRGIVQRLDSKLSREDGPSMLAIYESDAEQVVRWSRALRFEDDRPGADGNSQEFSGLLAAFTGLKDNLIETPEGAAKRRRRSPRIPKSIAPPDNEQGASVTYIEVQKVIEGLGLDPYAFVRVLAANRCGERDDLMRGQDGKVHGILSALAGRMSRFCQGVQPLPVAGTRWLKLDRIAQSMNLDPSAENIQFAATLMGRQALEPGKGWRLFEDHVVKDGESVRKISVAYDSAAVTNAIVAYRGMLGAAGRQSSGSS